MQPQLVPSPGRCRGQENIEKIFTEEIEMRITVYKTELNDDLHTELIKERAYNYSTGELNNPDSIVNLMNDVFHMNKLSEEYVYTIALNTKCHPIGFFEVSHGASNYSVCNPREIFNRLLLCGANSFVLLHNHPSGDSTPSKEDLTTFEKMKQCSNLMGISFLDNIIIGKDFYSFREKGLF